MKGYYDEATKTWMGDDTTIYIGDCDNLPLPSEPGASRGIVWVGRIELQDPDNQPEHSTKPTSWEPLFCVAEWDGRPFLCLLDADGCPELVGFDDGEIDELPVGGEQTPQEKATALMLDFIRDVRTERRASEEYDRQEARQLLHTPFDFYYEMGA